MEVKIQAIKLSVLASIVWLLAACAAFQYGYSDALARDQYLQVAGKDSFGFKRIQLIRKFHGAKVESFLSEKGLPQYIFEFKENGKKGVAMYYLAEEKAYIFQEKTWNQNSLSLLGIRDLTEFEYQRFGLSSGVKKQSI